MTTNDFKIKFADEKERLAVYQKNYITDGEGKVIVHIDELHQWEDNPKNAQARDMERLEKMIRKLGQFKPLIVMEDGTILGGNHRWIKQKEMGIEWVWVSLVYPKTEDEKMEYALADNDHIAEYDADLLAEKLKQLQGIDLTMFKVNLGPLKSLAELVDAYSTDESQEDEAPPLGDIPFSKLGEMYLLGRHKLICGDATVAGYYEALMGDEKADMVFTDPPYNVNYQGAAGGKREGILNDKMEAQQFFNFLKDSLGLMAKHSQGAFYVCMGHQEAHTLRLAFDAIGGHFQSWIIWVKNTFTLGGADWQNQHEQILYGWGKGSERYWAGYRDEGNVWANLEMIRPKKDTEGNTVLRLGMYTIKLKGKVEGQIMRHREETDIWEEKKPTKSEEHPTMKPIKLINKALRASSRRDDLVLDPFGGSGSTLIACEKMNRRCNMMELDPRYVDVIIKRWENLTGGKAQKLRDSTEALNARTNPK